MLFGGFAVFAVYLALLAIDEFLFHKRRGPSIAERYGNIIDLGLLAACFMVILLNEAMDAMNLYVMLAGLSLITLPKDELLHGGRATLTERVLHAFRYLMHAPLLITAASMWYFVHKSHSVMSLVLPGSIQGLYPLCSGFLVGLCALAGWQVYQIRRTRAAALALAQAAPAPASAPQNTGESHLD